MAVAASWKGYIYDMAYGEAGVAYCNLYLYLKSTVPLYALPLDQYVSVCARAMLG